MLLQRVADDGDQRLIGVGGIRTAFQCTHIPTFEAEREDVGRDIGTGFIDDADNTDRDAYFLDDHPVGTPPFVQDFSQWRFEGRYPLHTPCHLFDTLFGQFQSVVFGVGRMHPL